MLLMHVVGARPNFMKAAPVMAALEKQSSFTQALIHTGQHYDDNMSDVFFRELGLRRPDANLKVGSGSHSSQTAEIMLRIERVLLEQRPKALLVYGDVNSTIAAALVAVKLGIPIAHVEAGLRSFDRSMPEEINRVLTDRIADLLFTPSEEADENLLKEGIASDRIFRVGNVMIDSLVVLLDRAMERRSYLPRTLNVPDSLLRECSYAVVTMHRPSNVDDPDRLGRLMKTLTDISSHVPVIFPVHPRTRERLRSPEMIANGHALHLVDPIGYLDFLALQAHAAVVITDSGGIQEETTFLGVPCLTLRLNTERPITTTLGTNTLIGNDFESVKSHVTRILQGKRPHAKRPPLWDGHAGERIAGVLKQYFT